MTQDQLSIFKKSVGKTAPRQPVPVVAPTGDSTMMQTLGAYRAHLSGQYATKTVSMYYGDVREPSVYLDGKTVREVTAGDLEQWVAQLTAPAGRHIERKTLNRKVSAVHSYFAWLQAPGATTGDPAAVLMNARVQSPLPDYLYDTDVQTLYRVASGDTRTYLLVLVLLETGMKSQELFGITRAHVDTSNPYKPELWVKHAGKATKKDRKVALPAEFMSVYRKYLEEYQIEDAVFPFTDRFAQMLFVELKNLTGIQKVLTPKTLRHTHVIRAYGRGEDPELIFDRIGLAPDSRPEAHDVYSRLAAAGI